MEFVDGSDLKAVIEHRREQGQRVPVEEACLICAARSARASPTRTRSPTRKGRTLDIVHRDMSPPNVLITRHGEVKIADFGLAKANSQLEKSEPGIIKGKFSYLSPEAAHGRGGRSRARTSSPSASCSGRCSPGGGCSSAKRDLETVRLVQAARIPSLRSSTRRSRRSSSASSQKALARDPSQRYQTARESRARPEHASSSSIGRAVSSFDIAQLVREAMVARERERRQKQKDDKVSIIGSLIDEAMVEFTSLDAPDAATAASSRPKDKAPGGAVAAEPRARSRTCRTGAKDVDVEPQGRQPRPSLPMSYEAGNLAALEEDDEPAAAAAAQLRPRVGAASRSARARDPQPIAAARLRTRRRRRRESGGGSGALHRIVVVVVVPPPAPSGPTSAASSH